MEGESEDKPDDRASRFLRRKSRAVSVVAAVLIVGNIYGLYDSIRNPVTYEELKVIGRPYYIWENASGIATLCTALFMAFSFWLARKPTPIKPLIAERAEDDTAVRRKRDAKRFNERLKLSATFLNGIGASSFLAGAITPMLTAHSADRVSALYGLGIGIVCHLLGQLALSFWKTEE